MELTDAEPFISAGPIAKAKKPKKKVAKKATKLARRPARLDMRLTKAEKAKLMAKAKLTRRTISSIVLELIENMK